MQLTLSRLLYFYIYLIRDPYLYRYLTIYSTEVTLQIISVFGKGFEIIHMDYIIKKYLDISLQFIPVTGVPLARRIFTRLNVAVSLLGFRYNVVFHGFRLYLRKFIITLQRLYISKNLNYQNMWHTINGFPVIYPWVAESSNSFSEIFQDHFIYQLLIFATIYTLHDLFFSGVKNLFVSRIS